MSDVYHMEFNNRVGNMGLRKHHEKFSAVHKSIKLWQKDDKASNS